MRHVWQRHYANHLDAARDVADYIVGLYNPVRLHSTLGYLGPPEPPLFRQPKP